MAKVIELNNLAKFYGSSRGVEDINLAVEKGTIFGFLGPNGAGKTTTISMMLDLIRPTGGNIKIFGLDSVKDSKAIRRRIGFLAGDIALDKSLTGWQQVEYFGNLRGKFNKKYVAELADRLNCDLNRKFRTLSRGNKQKVGLILALMHKPDLLILDEPTSGLDPLIQAEFNRIVHEHKKAGKTAFISSHVLSEVQQICDDVAFIRAGSLITSKPVHELVVGLPKEVQILSSDKSLKSSLIKLTGFKLVSSSGQIIKGSFEGDINQLLKVIAKSEVRNITLNEPDLEDIFMGYYEDENV